VIAVALVASWFVAVLFAPVIGVAVLPARWSGRVQPSLRRPDGAGSCRSLKGAPGCYGYSTENELVD
jgi:multidrug efflux pump subunit AcrB